MYGRLLHEHLGRAIAESAPELPDAGVLLVTEAVIAELVKLEFVSIYELDPKLRMRRLIQELKQLNEGSPSQCEDDYHEIDPEQIEKLLQFFHELRGATSTDENDEEDQEDP